MHLQAQSTRQALQSQRRLVRAEPNLQVLQVHIGQAATPLAPLHIGPQAQMPLPLHGPGFRLQAGGHRQTLG